MAEHLFPANLMPVRFVNVVLRQAFAKVKCGAICDMFAKIACGVYKCHSLTMDVEKNTVNRVHVHHRHAASPGLFRSVFFFRLVIPRFLFEIRTAYFSSRRWPGADMIFHLLVVHVDKGCRIKNDSKIVANRTHPPDEFITKSTTLSLLFLSMNIDHEVTARKKRAEKPRLVPPGHLGSLHFFSGPTPLSLNLYLSPGWPTSNLPRWANTG